MTKKNRIKVVSLFLAGCLTFISACAPAQSEQSKGASATASQASDKPHTYKIEKKNIPLYAVNLDENNKIDLDMYFMDSVMDIPYITPETFKKIYAEIFSHNKDFDLKIEKDGDRVVFTRETDFPMVINFTDDTISFIDYDGFLLRRKGDSLMDLIIYSGFNEKGEADLFQRSDTSFERYGDVVTFKLGDYKIDLIYQDGEYYIPFQTLSDIILSTYSYNLLFNGETAFLAAQGNIEPIKEKYYLADPPSERSEELISFTYHELCLVLDYFYGLKDSHDIDDFEMMFLKANILQDLLSPDPQVAGQALADLTLKYLDDRHSLYNARSYLMKSEPKLNLGSALNQSLFDYQLFKETRSKYYPNGVPGYEEIGNTAYITMDGFNMENYDHYKEDYKDHPNDTIALMTYAASQIKRQGSPVKNIVLDLSFNGGGQSASAAFVIGSLLGNGSISVTNTLSGALVVQNYKVDLNLDRKFDEEDNLLDYNLFCLTSATSFSCGNLVPSVLKNSHRVTTLGQTSGGGSCVVYYFTTADGCPLRISGPNRLAYTKNGSFYDIDQGVEPDYVLANPKLFYDRQYLTQYINNSILGNR